MNIGVVNHQIQAVHETASLLAAARRYLQIPRLSRAEMLQGEEWAARADADFASAVAALAAAAPIRRTAAGTWAETWPEAYGETRRALLRSRGHDVRVERRGSDVTLLYAADSPEPLVSPCDRARARARAEVRGQ